MEKNTLLLIDLSKNFNLNEKNKQYIYLNKGNIHLNNCKQIKLKNFSNFRKKTYKALIKEFKKFILNHSETTLHQLSAAFQKKFL